MVLNEDPGYTRSLSLHSFLLEQLTLQEDLGFSGKSEQQLDEERGRSVST